MPVKPKKILKALYLFNLSFRNSIAKRAVQIGAVNSIAKTSAKGKKATPVAGKGKTKRKGKNSRK